MLRDEHLISSLIAFLDLFLFHSNNLHPRLNINPIFGHLSISSLFPLLNLLLPAFPFSDCQPIS